MDSLKNRSYQLFVKTAPTIAAVIPSTCFQIAFIPRVGLSDGWIKAQHSSMYFRTKGQLFGQLTNQVLPVPHSNSMTLLKDLLNAAKSAPNHYLQHVWPAGRLLLAANLIRYGTQFTINDSSTFQQIPDQQKLLVRVFLGGMVEYLLNSPLSQPYTYAASRISPHTILNKKPQAVQMGKLFGANGGVSRYFLKSAQIGVQFQLKDKTEQNIPQTTRDRYPLTSKFTAGFVSRSLIELTTIPVRNFAQYRNLNFSIQESFWRTIMFPCLGFGINVITKGISFGLILTLHETTTQFTKCSNE